MIKKIKALRQERADKKARALELLGLEARISEQETELIEIEARLPVVAQEIERIERVLAVEVQATSGVEGATFVMGRDRAEDRPWAAGVAGLGEFGMAVYRAMSGQGMDPRLMAAATGMGEAVPSDGGFAVPVEMGVGIERNMFESGDLLSRVDVRNISSNAITYLVMTETSRADGSRQGGVLGYWVDEGVAATATDFLLERMELKLRKVGALGYMTDELLQDAPALGGELEAAFSRELIFQVENKIYRGLGTSSPLGFLNASSLVSVAKETSQAAATINVTNLSKMWARMPARSKRNAIWLINVDCEPQLDELALSVGTSALAPRFVNYGAEGILTIKGRPVIAVEYAATVGTVGDISLVDLSQYRLIRKGGVQQASSIHVRFTQGESTFRAFYRVDGQPVPRSAITPFQGTATLSPFVVLATRA